MASDETSPAPSPPEKPKGAPRKKKSASQTEVLERAYATEKYPSEATRTLLGKELNLSDKQLQIWFTHRRFKDRRDGVHDEKLTFYAKNKSEYAHKKHEPVVAVAAAAVEDEEDEDGDNASSEPEGYPARVLAEERDDVELIAEHMDGEAGPRRKSGSQRPPMRPGPKPKFNAMAAAERAAISAVESQLCGPLRDDGPPLGFEFDPLPPRAFTDPTITEVPQTGGGSRESGSENHSERAHKYAREFEIVEKEVAEKKRRKVGLLKPSRGENGY